MKYVGLPFKKLRDHVMQHPDHFLSPFAQRITLTIQSHLKEANFRHSLK